MTDDKWQNAPPPRRGGYDWDDISKRLRARPGRWMRVAQSKPRSVQEAVNRGRIRLLRDDKWTYRCEVRNTSRDNNLADIWMTAERKED